LSALLVAPDRALAAEFIATLREARTFQVLADLKKYPTGPALEIRLRQYQPDVILLDVASDLEAASSLIRPWPRPARRCRSSRWTAPAGPRP
jgi:DNA-binding NarL/FixJ family response regulator